MGRRRRGLPTDQRDHEVRAARHHPARRSPSSWRVTTTSTLRSLTSDVNGDFPRERLRRQGRGGPRCRRSFRKLADAAAMRIGAPIARPSAVICIGMNYAAHAAESGSEPPTIPILFLKTTQHGGRTRRRGDDPPRQREDRLGVELGIVIGASRGLPRLPRGSRSPTWPASSPANDVLGAGVPDRGVGRAVVQGQDRPGIQPPTARGSSLPDEVDHHALGLRSFVNGEPRQDSNTSDMIFTVEHIVHHLVAVRDARAGRPDPHRHPQGEALSASTPTLAPGDVVEIEIDGLGRQRQEFVAWEAQR